MDIWWLDYIWTPNICEDVLRQEVRADIEWEDYPEIIRAFPEGHIPDAWAVGYNNKTGYYCLADGDTSWGIPNCDVLDVDEEGATLRTYIYQYDNDWYPCAMNELDVYITVVGYNPAPAVPTGFAASEDQQTGCVRLTWNANTEDDLDGYKIARKIDAGDFEVIADLGEGATYYVDEEQDWTTWLDFDHATYYKILAYDDVGIESNYCTPILQPTNDPQKSAPQLEEETDLPTVTMLLPSYPNPFNNYTSLNYLLAKRSDVHIAIFNILGEEVYHHQVNDQRAGKFSIPIDLTDRSSGVYLVRAVLADQVFMKKLLLVK